MTPAQHPYLDTKVSCDNTAALRMELMFDPSFATFLARVLGAMDAKPPPAPLPDEDMGEEEEDDGHGQAATTTTTSGAAGGAGGAAGAGAGDGAAASSDAASSMAVQPLPARSWMLDSETAQRTIAMATQYALYVGLRSPSGSASREPMRALMDMIEEVRDTNDLTVPCLRNHILTVFCDCVLLQTTGGAAVGLTQPCKDAMLLLLAEVSDKGGRLAKRYLLDYECSVARK